MLARAADCDLFHRLLVSLFVASPHVICDDLSQLRDCSRTFSSRRASLAGALVLGITVGGSDTFFSAIVC